jgi:hypothetical protein
MGVTVDGLIADNAYLPVDGRWYSGTACYGGPLTITMKPRIPGVKVYYTVQDPYFIWGPDRPGPANPRSKLYEGPIKDVGGIFRAQCFDASGKPVGGEYVKIFQYCPIQIAVEGAEEKYDSLGRTQGRPFHLKAVVEFSTLTGKKLRYRTTPPSSQADLEYTGPITISKTTTFWVGLAGVEGYQLQTTVGDDGFRQNLLTMDRVKFSTDAKSQCGDPEKICDGYANNPDVHWNGIGDCQMTIEMAVPRKINELEVVTWWGDGRAYRYTIEASEDGKSFKPIVDMSQNTKGSGPEGYKHTFDLMSIRYLRFHMMGNTTNNHGHLVEVRAFNTSEAVK